MTRQTLLALWVVGWTLMVAAALALIITVVAWFAL
jgi:hypothetical protein